MRPVEKSIRTGTTGIFKPYTKAKQLLLNELGEFCSFCERPDSLDVEHIYAKNCKDRNGTLIYAHLEYSWDNFLLACKNCNSIKCDEDIAIRQPYMPHENNLLHFIEVVEGGRIQIKPGIDQQDQAKTQAFIDLVGLDRRPGHKKYSNKDRRWEKRREVYNIAIKYRSYYTQSPPTVEIEYIVDLAKSNGFFSVWYYVFSGCDEVLDALINGFADKNGKHIIPFPGTHTASFDSQNHYATLPRP